MRNRAARFCARDRPRNRGCTPYLRLRHSSASRRPGMTGSKPRHCAPHPDMFRLALRHAKRFAEMSAAYLDKLNADQRRAVLHGVDEDTALLIIAGAGSGKTATLAHRVVHLVANGADPRRILLMTFSRRAAVEMTRRVERIGREAGRADRAVQARSSARSPARWRAPCPGPAPSTPSAPGCCGTTPRKSASTPPSPSMIARIPRT